MDSPCDIPRDRPSSRSELAAAAVGLAAVVLVAFTPLIRHPGWLLADGERPSVDHARPVGTSAIGNDLTRLFLPMHLRISEVVRSTGTIAGWDPEGFGGRPLVGNPQASLWYPPIRIVWWTGQGAALGWLTVGHLIWGGIGTLVLARSREVGLSGAFLAASAFSLSPYLLAQTMEGHLPHVWSASWYPWAFLCALALKDGRWGRGLFLPPVLAMGFLAGHPQESYYLVVTLGLGMLAAMVRWPRAKIGRYLAVFGMVMIASVGLSAVEWLPDAQAQVWGLMRGGSLRQVGRYSVGWENWLQLIGPRALRGASDYLGETNYWESLLSFGLVALGLSTAAVFSSGRRNEVRGWLAIAVLAVVFATGHRLGLYLLMCRVVPGMERFRVPSRSLFLAALAVAMLAGMGLDALRKREAAARTILAFGCGVAGVLIVGLLVGGSSAWLLGLRNLARDPVVWLGALGMIGAGVSRLALDGRAAASPSRAVWVSVLVCALCVIELVHHASKSVKVAPLGRFVKDEIREGLPNPGFRGPFRVRARDAFLDDLTACRLGLEKTNLGDWFQIRHAADLYETLYPIFDPPRLLDLLNPLEDWRQKQVRQAVLDRMGVAFLISDRKDVNARWPIATEGNAQGVRFWVYRNPTAMPRAYVVPRAELAPDDVRTVGLMPWIPAREAVLMPVDPLNDEPGPRQAYREAEYRSDHPDRVEVAVTTESPGYLVIGDTWMPGWKGTFDGRKVPVLRGNRAQRVVVIPAAGDHRLSMRYEPPGMRLGIAVSGLSGVGWAAFAIGLRRLKPTRCASGGTIPS